MMTRGPWTGSNRLVLSCMELRCFGSAQKQWRKLAFSPVRSIVASTGSGRKVGQLGKSHDRWMVARIQIPVVNPYCQLGTTLQYDTTVIQATKRGVRFRYLFIIRIRTRNLPGRFSLPDRDDLQQQGSPTASWTSPSVGVIDVMSACPERLLMIGFLRNRLLLGLIDQLFPGWDRLRNLFCDRGFHLIEGLGRSQTLPDGEAHAKLRAKVTSRLLDGCVSGWRRCGGRTREI
ncbi:hypothetical protein BJ322DRAFT_1087719 [Thelephora terrestris]|uniref:Uncharacterized protein n=1 Tax=Thelephora terrestris TaxID=56493 RepID=A0A9P6H5I3_9AGAM|nr:hypothetical protein BJ322DRAFT_1087719 [Thelephora terrestris]